MFHNPFISDNLTYLRTLIGVIDMIYESVSFQDWRLMPVYWSIVPVLSVRVTN